MTKVKIKTEDDIINIKNIDNIFYSRQSQDGIIWLYEDGVDGDLGAFKIWYDVEMDDREYITINHTITYLDTLDEL